MVRLEVVVIVPVGVGGLLVSVPEPVCEGLTEAEWLPELLADADVDQLSEALAVVEADLVSEVVDVLEGADVSEEYPDWLGVRDDREDVDPDGVPERDSRAVTDDDPVPVVDLDTAADLDPVEETEEVRELVIDVVPVTEAVELLETDTEAVFVTEEVDDRLCLDDGVPVGVCATDLVCKGLADEERDGACDAVPVRLAVSVGLLEADLVEPVLRVIDPVAVVDAVSLIDADAVRLGRGPTERVAVVVEVRVVVLLPVSDGFAVLVREVEAVCVIVPDAVADLLRAAVTVIIGVGFVLADCVEDAETEGVERPERLRIGLADALRVDFTDAETELVEELLNDCLGEGVTLDEVELVFVVVIERDDVDVPEAVREDCTERLAVVVAEALRVDLPDAVVEGLELVDFV